MQIVTGKNGLHLNAIILSQNQKQFCGGNCNFMNQNDNKNIDEKAMHITSLHQIQIFSDTIPIQT